MHYSILNGNSPHSPYGYNIDPNKNSNSNSYTITDYKKILSQFLSTSVSSQIN